MAEQESPQHLGDGPKAQGEKRSGGIRWLVGCALSVVVLAFLIRTFVGSPYFVPTGSMLETIQEGDVLFGEKVTYYLRDPEPGDVVTFVSPLDGDTLIKRVIAVGGQTVDLKDGVVYVDGEPLSEDAYTLGKPTYSLSDLAGSEGISYPYTVPENTVWVMGDNRTNSKDSRYFGPVSVDDVTSKAMVIYWPLSDFRTL